MNPHALIALLTLATAVPALARDALARVVTIGQGGLSRASVVEGTFERLEQAASFRPDIACLPETFTRGQAEPVTGPTIQRLSAWARQHACYVVCPILVSGEDGRVYNSAVLIDRAGRVVGRYDKIHPTEKELQGGVTPGRTDPPVFDTDFGRIGIQICFDVNWREGWMRLKDKGAQIIFFPTAYAAARQMPVVAFLTQSYIVTSTQQSVPRLYDITGDLLDAGTETRGWAGAALKVGKRLFEVDYNVPKMRAVEKKYGSRVEVTWFDDDDWITLASADPDLTVSGIIQEFGLTPLDDYIIRAGKAQDEHRAPR
jgi:beta-ureidopropionase